MDIMKENRNKKRKRKQMVEECGDLSDLPAQFC